jgi:thioredoxin-related protein
MKKVHLWIFFLVFTSCFVKNSRKSTSHTTISATDIYQDSISYQIKKKTMVVLFKEPSCTGCKENLAIFANKNHRKLDVVFLLEQPTFMVSSKTEATVLRNKYLNTSQILYSTDDKFLTAKVNDTTISNKSFKFPQVVIVSKQGEIQYFDYDDLFEEVYLSKYFLSAVKNEFK